MNKITVELFSDVLCIWAYGAQIRIDQLTSDYGAQIELRYRFIPVFAAAEARIDRTWGNRGGYEAFNAHLTNVTTAWDHARIHPEIWLHNRPASSTVPHLYLKAAQLLEQSGVIPTSPQPELDGRSIFEDFLWRMRCAFFEKAENIATVSILDGLVRDSGIPVAALRNQMDSGSAHAALHLDTEARDQYQVPGSPTLVFNEGRQRLYGNVGYRIIEANIRELLRDSQYGEASWC